MLMGATGTLGAGGRLRPRRGALRKRDRTPMQGIDLRGAILPRAYMEGLILDGADLTGANLDGTVLKRASLRGVTFDGAFMQDVNLRTADLTDASLRGVDLRRAVLVETNFKNPQPRYRTGYENRPAVSYRTNLLQLLSYQYDAEPE